MFATSLALIAQAFAGRERGTAFGIYGAVLGGAVAIGPLLGGAITSGIGWRWIFFLNLPLGVFAIAVCLAKVQDSRDPTARRIDWIGFVTFSLSLFMLVYALVQGNAKGWHSPTIVGLLVGSAVPDGGVPGGRVAPARPHARPDPVQAAGDGRRVPGLLHPVGLDLRHVPVSHAVPPGGTGLRAVRRRPPVPARDRAGLRGRTGGRQTHASGSSRGTSSASACSAWPSAAS